MHYLETGCVCETSTAATRRSKGCAEAYTHFLHMGVIKFLKHIGENSVQSLYDNAWCISNI